MAVTRPGADIGFSIIERESAWPVRRAIRFARFALTAQHRTTPASFFTSGSIDSTGTWA